MALSNKSISALAPQYDLNLALLKAVAIIMVITLHIRQYAASLAPSIVCDAASRTAVPLFLMVTGALLLPKREDLKIYYAKRAVRILPAFFFWSLFYLAISEPHLDSRTILHWRLRILEEPTYYHLWYLYVLIGIYIILPILRVFYLHAKEQEKLLLIILLMALSGGHLLVTVLSMHGHIPQNKFQLVNFGGYIGYVVLGAYIYEKPRLNSKQMTTAFLIFISMTLCIMRTRYLTIYSLKLDLLSYHIYSFFVIAASAALFAGLLSLKLREGKAMSAVTAIATCSLGIYCLHPWFINIFVSAIWIDEYYADWWFTPVTVAVILAACLLICGVMRKAPLFKYLV